MPTFIDDLRLGDRVRFDRVYSYYPQSETPANTLGTVLDLYFDGGNSEAWIRLEHEREDLEEWMGRVQIHADFNGLDEDGRAPVTTIPDNDPATRYRRIGAAAHFDGRFPDPETDRSFAPLIRDDLGRVQDGVSADDRRALYRLGFEEARQVMPLDDTMVRLSREIETWAAAVGIPERSADTLVSRLRRDPPRQHATFLAAFFRRWDRVSFTHR